MSTFFFFFHSRKYLPSLRLISTPIFCIMAKWVSRSLSPIWSPPGGVTTALPKRTKRGAARTTEALNWLERSGSRSKDDKPEGSIVTAWSSRVTFTPSFVIRSSMTDTSEISGTFVKVVGESARRAAGISFKAAFLLPESFMVPSSFLPPVTINLDI